MENKIPMGNNKIPKENNNELIVEDLKLDGPSMISMANLDNSEKKILDENAAISKLHSAV